MKGHPQRRYFKFSNESAENLGTSRRSCRAFVSRARLELHALILILWYNKSKGDFEKP